MPFIKLEDISQSEPVPGFVGRFIHSENMTVADWKIREGSILSEHAHPHEQISYLLEGRFELRLGGKTRVLTPGSIAIIPSNEPHEGKALTDCHLVDMFYPVREDLRQVSE